VGTYISTRGLLKAQDLRTRRSPQKRVGLGSMTRVETKYRRRDEGTVFSAAIQDTKWLSTFRCDFCHSQPAFGSTNLSVKCRLRNPGGFDRLNKRSTYGYYQSRRRYI
jgi:hypothetical protein